MAIQVTIMSIDFDSFEEPITEIYADDEITVGSAPINHVVLDKPEISPHHVRLKTYRNGSPQPSISVLDLGSAAGTLLERELLPAGKETILLPNQRIIVGSYLLKPTYVEVPAGAQANETVSMLLNAIESTPSEAVVVDAAEEAASEETATEISAQDAVEVIASPEPTVKTKRRSTRNNLESETKSVETEVVVSEGEAPETPARAEFEGLLVVHLNGAPDQNLDFEAARLLRLTGRIVRRGEALPGVLLASIGNGSTHTDDKGEFNFYDVLENTALGVTAQKVGYEFDLPSAAEAPLVDNSTMEIVAHKLHTLRGRVLHKDKPLADVRVASAELGIRITNSNGEFSFGQLREGTSYALAAQRDKFAFDVTGSTGVLEKDETISFEARELFSLRGRIVHRGVPLAHVQVECLNVGHTTTDDSGYYEFPNLPEGAAYTLRASKDGFVFRNPGELSHPVSSGN